MTAGRLFDGKTLRHWHAAHNVLAIRLDNFGDMLMTTPALAGTGLQLDAARPPVPEIAWVKESP